MRNRFTSRTGGFAKAKRYWVCQQCDQLHQEKRKECAKCQHKKMHYFDSQKEMKRFYVLKRRANLGRLQDLKIKPKFDFPMTGPDGSIVSPFTYVADFSYRSPQGDIVEDVKPSNDARSWDPVFKLKKRTMSAFHGIEVSIVTNPEE